jgi:ribonucleoside-diphosphate reductase alpha chain
MDTIATLVSVSLQYGVPVESLVRKFEHVRFEPSGMTRNPEIPIAKSLVDYIFRYLAMEFVPGYRAANAPRREKKEKPEARSQKPEGQAGAPASLEDTVSGEMSSKLPAAPTSGTRPSAGHKPGNGHGPRIEADTAKSFDYAGDVHEQAAASDAALEALHHPHGIAPEVGTPPSGASLRLAIVADPVSQQGSHLQADAPACDVCGSITVRSGTCYKCLNCGNSMGCS